jgi:phosphopantetheinyl transferase (holo-ACP synthase)
LGKPEVVLYGRAAAYAREQGLGQWAISLSHTDEHAVAMVVALPEQGASPPAGG